MPGILIGNAVIKGNGLITSKPVVVSAIIAQTTPTKVDITFDQALDAASVPATTAFTLAGKTISNVAIVGAVVTLTVTVRYEEGDVVTVDYTKPVLNPLQSDAGYVKADSFAALAVTNNFLYPYATLTPTGTGAGVATIMMAVSSDTTLVMSGAARFYSDAAGTLDESTTWSITSGANRTRYIRCTAVSQMKFPHPELFTKWGDVFVAAGWTTPTNSPSISMDVSVLYNLTQYYVQLGFNTNYGQVGVMTGLTALRSANGAAIDINFTPLTLLDYVSVGTTGTLTGSLNGLTIIGSSLYISGNPSSTLTGTFNSGFTYGGTDIVLDNTNISYSIHAWPANMSRFSCSHATNKWSVADVTQCIIDAAATTWAGSKLLILSQSSMADTTQGGIWGDFSGVPAPSALAIAYKTIKRTLTLTTVSITGITAPGGSGDGTGFPAGFGDWYRS